MNIVNNRNIISLNLTDDDYSQIEYLRRLISYNIDNKKATKFQTLLYGLVDTYEIALDKQSKEMKEMKNFLAKQNVALKKEIISFINTNTKLKNNQKERVKYLISTIGKFSLTRDTIVNEEDETTYKVITFIRNTIRNIVKVFPNIIINF